MPDRRDRSPNPFARVPQRAAGADDARLHVLETAIVRWLREAGMRQTAAAVSARGLLPEAARWLDDHGAEAPRRLSELAQRLHALAHAQGASAATFLGAFARTLVEQAVDEVALEAQRAGHAAIFDALRPWLYAEPSDADRDALGPRLALSRSALDVARSRLQRRLRQRLEAGLRLWAASPETRKTLRRQLHESLIGPESAP